MFGYVKPEKSELKVRELNEFRAFYCGVCTSLHKSRYLAKLFLSYDAVFFALILTSIRGKILEYKKRFCGVGLRNILYYESEEISLAASNFLLLLKYKLLDDVRDERNFVEALLLNFFKNITGSSATLESRLQALIRELSETERKREPTVDKPAEIFGNIVALFFEDLGELSSEQRTVLIHLARHIGKWIYVLDAFDDLKKDISKGNYNPLAIQFGFTHGMDIQEFIDKIRPKVREYLFKIYDEVVLAYNLLELKTYKGILDNIVYLGLFEETERVLSGRKTCKKLYTA
ncbi:hypothetical protein Ferpe_1786 [Fervidobacterium pennivorans DSM 9078]|jgi:hypothetical protein|uniref:Uncharacterized protein n=1 Tax=Fervidobacterium pennivorans (strain DSM 9078 / Ven5) TaxID=771875 RepID=H9UE96_FERPD|nr:DUF5685 family protein [Fervidobacterium pennivorans]AFG35839.1 hypothetical protein Ferpe_1786 [Fervidobacterium pennivorans DSM 9078]